ncbi:hypothetical protein KORDIASMS9_04276 [Kordia sp. SMS9]|uniref:hypothetical protein n=1 Tax=Kordia sp. SMS9 TaxID=2282170 RepID=UPI000E1088F3|nr:hypothetical protein [Kordia sp. SMS9]AXG72014.1 hypothetical protein KORDIASMS9_04276 [Kordia sp. SMS9]
MKKHKPRSLRFTKFSIANIQELKKKAINGGTEPVSELNPPMQMTQMPDEQTVCYAIQ